MKYYIGIDGGGSKTHCIIANEKKEQVFECFGEATNFLIIGTTPACKILHSLIETCKKQLSIGNDQIGSLCIAVSGAGRQSDAKYLEEEFTNSAHNKSNPFRNVCVESDATAALTGAFHEDAGIILISGTGSIILGKDTHGKTHRAGGFGRIIGDEGSGFSLGCKGISAISKQFDGRGEITHMTEYLKSGFEISNAEELITAILQE